LPFVLATLLPFCYAKKMHFPGVIFLFSLFLSTTITTCNKGNTAYEAGDSAEVELFMKDVSYGDDTAQKLDIYLPEKRNYTDTKVILFIHGGGWAGGDKTEFNEAISAIRNRLPGYAIFNINYRLAYYDRNRFPSQVSDIQSALNFIESNSGEFKINPDKVCLVGASAGAHLAMLQAYKYNSDRRIKAVIDLFGPNDLIDLYNNHPIPQQARPVLINLLGKTPVKDASLYQQASPINFINAHSSPTLIFHGVNDIVVPISQSNKLKAKLQANNVKVEMTSYVAEGHGWYGKNLSDTYNKTVEFIKENVH
jgi:acetyl esterase/lipase